MPSDSLPKENRLIRWLSLERPIPRKVAVANRREDFQHIRAQIKDLRDELQHLAKTPLPKSTIAYIPVYPGDPQYEKADTAFDPIKFSGTWKSVTTTTT